jgi:diguanylate cyclase (GGDEF)-like protein|tara:strand:- start:300 stop:572 length:273 start_codon:yes stop_codon:yes gene_type:complete
VAARLGGEEFGILLPETDQPGAVQLANRLRESIANQHISHGETKDVNVTISVGVATITKRGCDNNVLKITDEQLYKAKHSGPNMVSCTET